MILKEKVKKLLLYFLGLIIIVEGIGLYYGFRRYKSAEEKIVSYIESLNFILREGGGFRFSIARSYINPEHYAIRHMAEVLKSPEEIYLFCAHEVHYNPVTTENNLYDYNVLMESRESNCAGQSNLLCSLLRAKWASKENCRVVYGSILKEGQRVNHAWVKLFWNGQWIILDPTVLTPIRHFGGWTRDEFYRTYKVVPVFEYNDTFVKFRVIE